MESGFRIGFAGNPYKELQMEMEHIPYIEPYGYGWCFPWWGITPPYFFRPCEHSCTWTTVGGTWEDG